MIPFKTFSVRSALFSRNPFLLPSKMMHYQNDNDIKISFTAGKCLFRLNRTADLSIVRVRYVLKV